MRIGPVHCFGPIALVATLVPGWGAAQVASESLEELQVRGARIRLDVLRKEAVAAENKFYQRYNELNGDDAFDVNCRTDAATGTRIPQRTCRAAYQEDALREEGVIAFQVQQFRNNFPRVGIAQPTTVPAPAAVLIEALRPQFQQNMRRVVGGSAELGQLLAERVQAVERLNRERRRLSGNDAASGDNAGLVDSPVE
jgi:hypothetical protein